MQAFLVVVVAVVREFSIAVTIVRSIIPTIPIVSIVDDILLENRRALSAACFSKTLSFSSLTSSVNDSLVWLAWCELVSVNRYRRWAFLIHHRRNYLAVILSSYEQYPRKQLILCRWHCGVTGHKHLRWIFKFCTAFRPQGTSIKCCIRYGSLHRGIWKPFFGRPYDACDANW